LTTLTEPARLLLEAVQGKPVKVVFFTFGEDYPVAAELARRYRCAKPVHMFFIARVNNRRGDEFWAFRLPKSRGDGTGSKCIDWETKNPSIKQEAIEKAMKVQAEAMKEQAPNGDTPSRKSDVCRFPDVDADEYRLIGLHAFEQFVDRLLFDGDVVFRAAYDPANENFCGRKNNKCKVLASSFPTLVYDDNPHDWHVFRKHQTVHVVSSGKANERRRCTDFIDELKRFRREVLVDAEGRSPCFSLDRRCSESIMRPHKAAMAKRGKSMPPPSDMFEDEQMWRSSCRNEC